MRRDQKRHKFIARELLSVKHTNSGKWDHRSFFAFDVSAIEWHQIVSARLRLNLVPSKRGIGIPFASDQSFWDLWHDESREG